MTQTAPLRFHSRISGALADKALTDALAGVKDNFIGKRAKAVKAYNESADFQALREYGKRVRDDAIARMPALLRQFADNAERAGATVLWARDSAEARALMEDIARRHNVRVAVKSKSMATEEIALNDGLSAAGVDVVETDLGEFIIQLAGEPPSHIIAPAVHKTRADVSALFEQHLNVRTSDIPTLTAAARAHLRDKFFAADMGISGANFLIADTGSALIVTNEGNGRMSTTLPRVHVTLAGIDKIIARSDDIPQMLTLLTHSATGQRMSNYVSMTNGASRAKGGDSNGDNDGDPGGPQHVYIVLLDNGRSKLRNSDYREMLRCIRCGACMNHCPVYHSIGGHAYGSVYMGPMGQVLTPALGGIESAPDLPYAATMCGACAVACPVKIPLPTLLRRLRAERVRRRLTSPLDRLFIRIWSHCALHPRLYALLTAQIARFGHLLGNIGKRRGSIRRLPGLGGWFNTRDLPAPAKTTFRQQWRKELRHQPSKQAPQ